MKVYLNPFSGILREVKEKDEAFILSVGISYNDFWEAEEVKPLLAKLATAKQTCMGKFDLFNKWILHTAKSDKGLTQVLRGVYLKPNWVCTKCKNFKECCSIHLNLADLDRLWHEIYLTKADMFTEIDGAGNAGGPNG